MDIHKLNTKNCPAKEGDYVIIAGDFGLVWTDNKKSTNYKEQEYWLKWLENKPFTTLFVDGNHENFNLLNSFPVEEWNGGKVHYIRKNKVIHLTRGQIFNIENKSIFTFGGADSADKQYRKENINWWPQEMPNEKEKICGNNKLAYNNYKVDYIITHCAPSSIIKKIDTYKETDELTDYFNDMYFNIKFKHWFCGHYHQDSKVENNFTILYNNFYELT